ncbi:DEAD/DEAH box helicase [Aquamicrobium zhengzhouense]|uniref:DEAD/DEAH box helicase n=1 Tax=Aquamicrobium zhengzhouense TaxID=2781738 RepID=A0ABS0SIT4_9HYPH|nr:DEAD/DEAH box helicase [Aquamicrobium zhengzhouense]MBI1622781.1 DEAD/DEAH box helicase [Aquamicrobium zhengzhouense]
MTQIEGIVPALAAALATRGYADLTPVQKAVIAPELAGSDVLVSAQTGSGKTVAFGLAIAPTVLGESERFGRAELPYALAVAPTRELAQQVRRELEWLYAETGAVIASCVGGMDMRTERRALERGAHIVVGTPGRLRDHITRGGLDMSQMRAVVLDEADEMLDLGFREDLEFILESAPEDRRTLLFSATVPPAIEKMAKNYQRDAVRVSTASERKQHVDIEYRALTVAPSDRENAIINVLRYYDARNALVFCSTRAAVNHLMARFNNRGFQVVALSGELSQNERMHALQAMRDGRAKVCIATDVAARGIDLPHLDLVVHADLPTNPDTLLHRSGRTGRAGRKGVSALIVPTNLRRKADRLLQNAKIVAEWTSPPSADEVSKRDDERMMSDPLLQGAVGEEEAEAVAALIETYGADRIAAAFVRQWRSGRSAPEELIELSVFSAPTDRGERREPAAPREEFGESVWFTISAGRRQSAEPRWLIPLLCRVGKITKAEIGAIKMQPEETYVQIAAARADGFEKSVGKAGELQNGITISRMNGAPDFSRSAGRSGYADRAPHGERGPKPEWKQKRAFGDSRGPRKEGWQERKPFDGPSADGPARKPWAKKPGKAAPAAKPGWAAKKPKRS